MNRAKRFSLILLGLGLWGGGAGTLARAGAATVTLPCTTNMTGYASRGTIQCMAYFMSDPNAAPPALIPPYLQLGTQPGPITNRIFLSFAASNLLKNTNITSAQLQFNVLDVTNWTISYLVRFRAFSTTGTECPAIYTDAADGADYGSSVLAARHGPTTVSLNSAALGDLAAAMNAGQGFELGLSADDRQLALISGYYSSAAPTLTVTYDCTPATPTGLAANSTCGAVNLSWNPVAGAPGYQVFRGGVLVGRPSGTSFTDLPGDCVAHAYTVAATNGCSAGPASSPFSAQAGCSPAAPGAVTASDGSYCDHVHITWSSAAGASSYGVTRDGHWILGTTLTVCDDNPGDTSSHSYVVWATNTCGTAQSAANAGYVGSKPVAPTTLTGTHGNYPSCVSLSWSTVGNASSYQVWRGTGANPATSNLLVSGVTSAYYNDCSVPVFTTNWYWVVASNNCGFSAASPGDYGWVSVVPAAPTLTASYGTASDHIDLSWNAVAGANRYVLYRNTASSTSGATGLANLTTTSYSDTSVASCTKYWYWVRATNISGFSDYSAPAVGFAGTVPDVPTNVVAADAGPANGIDVSWNPVSGAAGYALWRAPAGSPGSRSLLASSINGLTYQDSAVAVCTHYSYWVTATNTCTASGYSQPADGYVSAGPPMPTNLVASAGTHAFYVQVCWDPTPGAGGYLVLTNASDDPGTATLSARTANTCLNDYAITPGTTNYYWVRATNACGASDFTASAAGYRGEPVLVTLQTVPAGLSLIVDGTNRVTSPQSFAWEPASCHALSVPNPQAGPTGTRYRFDSWDAPGLGSTVCAWSNATYTASFVPQHFLGTTASPSDGGTVVPPSGWYDETNSLTITALPASGFIFTGWTGTYTGSNNPIELGFTNGSVSAAASFLNTNPCTYALTPSGTNIGFALFMDSITVTAGNLCAWSAGTSNTWIHTASAGAGNGTVYYTVDPNADTNSRTGTIWVGGQSFVILQAASCGYTFAPAGTNVGPAAMSGAFMVTAGSGCAWTAYPTAGWIHTTSSGTGDGTILFSVDANTGTSARSGFIVVQGQSFAISQAAPITSIKGTYTGLFYPVEGATVANAGLLTASTTTKGGFTGKIFVEGGSYPFRGQLGASGQTNVTVARRGKLPLNVQLALQGQDLLSGTVASSDGSWSAPFEADRAVFSASSNPCPFAGFYTCTCPGNADPAASPGGDTYVTFKVASNGKVTAAAGLADGTKVTQSTWASQSGRVPLFAPLYQGGGLVIGWTWLPTDASGSVSAQPLWSKPATSKGLYRGGFRQPLTLSGMKYVAPGSHESLFTFSSGLVEIGGGDLADALSLPVTVGANNKVLPSTATGLRVNLNAASGKFSGSFKGSSSGKLTPFQGILVRPLNAGYGYFLGADQSGYVRIGPAGQ